MSTAPMQNGPSIAEEEFKEELLVRPYDYLGNITEKNTRTMLTESFNYWLAGSEEDSRVIDEATEMMCQACQLIDDIEVEVENHKESPVAHRIYGIPNTLNSANYIYFLALSKIVSTNHTVGPHVFAKHVQQIHRGQGMDIQWRRTGICPTEEEYKEMILRKTGGLLGFTMRSLQLFSDNISDYSAIVETLSLLLDIRDDYACIQKKINDMTSNCEDISAGRYSFPIIHGIKNSPDNEILRILYEKVLIVFTIALVISGLETGGICYDSMQTSEWYVYEPQH
ncbi:hypothetical protein ScPMuIL_005061 [Solemya velum]